MNVNTGSTWRSSDSTEFIVEAVEKIGGEVWIHYAKAGKFGSGTEQKYSCLEGAFLSRFFPCPE